ncbi:protein of unknown function DUF86 [Leucobacter sp. 7(1)]|uniref:HepT-like ribonuclease domain-containing protein n=1 Tax=Leucobacter sp. 7(1) TaxID=1255613 RepID=UPI00097F44FA|nr:HepT-like ribonuclease domain-containing protein [Leucobacter sp. 7(1)]SJN09948.1 protein of unknown function DUF86 [Leucobacter sp. 7(1)]
MRPEARTYLWEAAEAAKLAYAFARERSLTEFSSDILVRSAVERQLGILGEALNRLRRIDPGVADRVPNLARIVGMRNLLAHEYGDIDTEIVWRAATTDMTALISVLGAMLGEP